MPFDDGISGAMFTIMPVFFIIVFVLAILIFALTIFKGLKQWQNNNAQPVLIVPAKLVTKRENSSSSHHTDTDGISHDDINTTYYITFEVESGSRMEFNVPGHEYGLLAEGDFGKLKFQGTRFLGFERSLH